MIFPKTISVFMMFKLILYVELKMAGSNGRPLHRNCLLIYPKSSASVWVVCHWQKQFSASGGSEASILHCRISELVRVYKR